MSWPIGYGRAGARYATDVDGSLVVDGVRVTGAEGWLELKAPAVEPRAIHVRVHVASDADGRPFLYCEEVATRARRYSGVFAFVTSDGERWGAVLAERLHAEIALRVAAGHAHARERTSTATVPVGLSPPPATAARAETVRDGPRARVGQRK